MKVLLLDVNCKSGSTGKIIYDLYTQLNENGHTAAIAYGRGAIVNEHNIIKFSSNIEVYTHAFLTRVTGLTGCFSYFATRKLLKFMDEFKPDIVHLNDMHGYFVNIIPIIKYLKEKEIKTIWTFHCEFMYTGKCGYSYDCEKWKSECSSCPNLKEYPKSLIFDFTKKMFNIKKDAFKDFNNLTIVAPSKWLSDRIKQSFLKEKEIVVIHNGVDTENIFHRREYQHLRKRHNITNEKIVIAVAPDIMSERKGGRHVLQLAKKMKNENIKFILIGVTDLNEKFDDNVIALGRTENQSELAEYYSMADVFVICSKKETFSMTCAEALCCGTPVLGFKCGAPETVFTDEYASFVAYGDIYTLKKKINAKLEKRINYEFVGTSSQNKYSNEVMLMGYNSVYSKGISSKSK